ncbi:MAG TPA: hydrogenase maturation nickel metallochaperone HypA [Candidatus Deferrimicrobium sp.]|nr:hydrogenase maturation nickel metallochaperone HypA [Candidatus Deferrimicrobium sp.]
MHEMSIAAEIIDAVQQKMDEQHLTKVTAVGLRLGRLSGINAEALAFCFEAATQDGALAAAKLSIEEVPMRADCRTCSANFEVEDFIFVCPRCGSNDTNVLQGDELHLAYIVAE